MIVLIPNLAVSNYGIKHLDFATELTVEECRIVLIPNLSSNLDVFYICYKTLLDFVTELTVEECKIVLIPKLASNLAVSNSLYICYKTLLDLATEVIVEECRIVLMQK